MRSDPTSLPPAARLASFRDYHCPRLTRREADVLVCHALGMDDRETGDYPGLSRRTVQNHAAAARGKVVPPGLSPARANAQAWAPWHLACCLATRWAVHTSLGVEFAQDPQFSGAQHSRLVAPRRRPFAGRPPERPGGR